MLNTTIPCNKHLTILTICSENLTSTTQVSFRHTSSSHHSSSHLSSLAILMDTLMGFRFTKSFVASRTLFRIIWPGHIKTSHRSRDPTFHYVNLPTPPSKHGVSPLVVSSSSSSAFGLPLIHESPFMHTIPSTDQPWHAWTSRVRSISVCHARAEYLFKCKLRLPKGTCSTLLL